MYRDTPNKEEIDWLEDEMQDIFQYEKLKDCDLEYLNGQHYLIENRFLIFKATFPAEESLMEGDFRAYVLDNPNETKESLTDAERARLMMIKEEAKMELHRAIGHRKELRREHRNKLANSVADLVKGLAQMIPSWP